MHGLNHGYFFWLASAAAGAEGGDSSGEEGNEGVLASRLCDRMGTAAG